MNDPIVTLVQEFDIRVQTRYLSNAAGRGGIRATATANGQRLQKTFPYHHERTSDQNHSDAAAEAVSAWIDKFSVPGTTYLKRWGERTSHGYQHTYHHVEKEQA